ncbi:MAG: glycosyltransferase family 2 protein [Candidatus Adiutrix sp.]|jgi:dolichol-phosphate mannosyltransferase|nr:glycosyltransferase family 2 protein [Candidatus Adiutrix sp.]
MSKIKLSVVIPVYGAPRLTPLLYERLVAALSPWADFELIMVNDACPLGSGLEIEKLAAADARVKYIDLLRNYGQHVAISVGLDYADGDYVVVMDCDLQDQPEEIKKMYDQLESGGYDAVFAVRGNRQDAWRKRFCSKCFRLVYNLLLEDALWADKETANFSVITRRTAAAYRRFGEKERLYGAIIARIVPEIALVEVAHAARPALGGGSAYSLRKSVKLAAGAIIANSNRPLIFSVYCALGLFVLAFFFAAKVVASYFLYGSPVMGWPSTIVALCFFFGLQMLFLGVLGAYVGNIALESKRRPLYLVSKTLNAGKEVSEAPQSAPTSRQANS